MTQDNGAHSFTEAAQYEENPQLKLYLHKIDVEKALQKFIDLHEREIKGDATITYKEWQAAIKNGKKALEK